MLYFFKGGTPAEGFSEVSPGRKDHASEPTRFHASSCPTLSSGIFLKIKLDAGWGEVRSLPGLSFGNFSQFLFPSLRAGKLSLNTQLQTAGRME